MANPADKTAKTANNGDHPDGLESLLELLESDAPVEGFDRRFCEGLARLFGAELASILDYDPVERALRFRYSMDLSEDERARFFIRLGEGICGSVVYTGRVARVENAMESSKPSAVLAKRTGRRVGALMASPAVHRGRCVSVVEIMNRRSGPFTEEDAGTLRALSALYAARRAESADSGARLASASARQSAPNLPDEPAIIGSSAPIESALRIAIKAGAGDIPVLILGESGTGKELFARRIHDAGPRARHPFVAINCAALPEHLLESELFGHARGAFTGADRARRGRLEEAESGTVFLDEIGDMSPACQADVLRTLDRGEICPVGSNQVRRINVRFIAATHRPIDEMARGGGFRADLYYRLCGVELRLPPLRERSDDIPLLADIFLRRAAAKAGRPVAGFEPETLRALRAYPWPGNVRELQNTIERVVLMSDRARIAAEDLPEAIRASVGKPPPSPAGASAPGGAADLPDRIMLALRETAYAGTGRWNLAEAARRLGIPRKTLEYKVRKLGAGRS